MPKHVMTKMQSKKGETLIESLISLLIALLAMGFVSTASIAAANMNETNQTVDEKYSNDLQAAEAHTAGGNTITNGLSIHFGSDSEFMTQYDSIEIYGNEDGAFASFK